MKLVPAVIGVVIAGALGYVVEPVLRPMLVAKAEETEEADEAASGAGEGRPAEEPVASGEDAFDDAGPAEGDMAEAAAETPVVEEPGEPVEPTTEIPAWVAGLEPAQLPEKVSLKKIARVPLPGSPQPMELPAGAKVTPVRVEGTMLVISPFSGPIEGAVAIIDTDLLEQLGDTPPEPVAVVEEVAEDGDAGGEAGNAVVGATAGDMAAIEEPMGTFDDGSGETIEEAPAVGPLGLDAEGLVKAMQSSISSGQIEEFTGDQVQEWQAGEVETVDGQEYQTGIASYRAETIFGVKTIQAKALVRDGKVVRWIWPKSGMEIK